MAVALGAKVAVRWVDKLAFGFCEGWPLTGPKTKSKRFTLRYDPERTKITGAKLSWTISYNSVYFETALYFDALEVDKFSCWWCSGTRESEVDIDPERLAPGEHELSVLVQRAHSFWGQEFPFSVTLVIYYEGDEPGVEEPVPPEERIWEYLTWAFVIAGAGVLGILALRALREAKEVAEAG